MQWKPEPQQLKRERRDQRRDLSRAHGGLKSREAMIERTQDCNHVLCDGLAPEQWFSHLGCFSTQQITTPSSSSSSCCCWSYWNPHLSWLKLFKSSQLFSLLLLLDCKRWDSSFYFYFGLKQWRQETEGKVEEKEKRRNLRKGNYNFYK